MNEFAFVLAGAGFLTILVSGFLYIWAGFFPNPEEVVRSAKRMLAFGILLLLTGLLIAAFLDAGEIPPHPVVEIPAAHLAIPVKFGQEQPSGLLLILGAITICAGLTIWLRQKKSGDGFFITALGIFFTIIGYLSVLDQTIRLSGG